MDYHSMKRKELQALCKKHNISANLTNAVMADKLTELLKAKQKSSARQPPTCMKSSVEIIDETEPVVTRRQAKKVRFSPNNELVEYELRSEKKKALVTKTKGKGKSVAIKVDKPVVDNDSIVKLTEDVQIPVKLTRSRVQIMEKDGVAPVNEKKQCRRVVNDVVQGSGSVEEPVGSRVRVTRSKAEVLNDDSHNLNPQVEKNRGRKNAKNSEKVEPSKEIVDIPVRVTRSREHTLKENIGIAVTDTVAEKKRTRREMKAVNPSQEDNQEVPKRKLRNSKEIVAEVPESQYDGDKGSRRSRRNESKVEDSSVLDEKVSKVEVAIEAEVTRSKAQVVEKSSKGNSKVKAENEESKTIQVEHASRNRRKSVVQPDLTVEGNGTDKPVVGNRVRVKETEMVESLNVGTRKTRRTQSKDQDVVQSEPTVEGKRTDKPVVGKRGRVKETEMVEPLNIGTRKTRRTQSENLSDNLSMIDQGVKDKEHVTRSGKDASRNEKDAVANATAGSNSSRKRKAGLVVEDQVMEIDRSSLVDGSPKRLTRSSSNSEGKKQLRSSLKTPTSKQSGATYRGKSSQKRAKLTVSPHATKQSDSEDHAEKSITLETPVPNLESSETDKVTTEGTVASDESVRRLTRSAIKSDRKTVGSSLEKGDKKKQPSWSAIKGQPIGVSVDETARRVTRSGIKHGGNSATKLSEKVDKKKQPSRSTIKEPPLENAQMFTPEVAEVGLSPDVVSGSEEAEGQSTMSDQITVQDDIIVQSENLKEPKEMESTKSGPGFGKLQIDEEIEVTRSGSQSEKLQIDEVVKEQIDEIVEEPVVSVGKTAVQDDTIGIQSEISTEVKEVELTKSGPGLGNQKIDAEKKGTKSGSESENLQIDKIVEELTDEIVTEQIDEFVKEPVVSVGMTVVVEENVDISLAGNDDADNTCDVISNEAGISAVGYASVEQSDLKSELKEMEALVEPSVSEGVEQHIEDDAVGFEQDALTRKDTLEKLFADDHGVADDEDEKQLVSEPAFEDKGADDIVDELQIRDGDNRDDAQKMESDVAEQSIGDDNLQRLGMDENDIKDGTVASQDNSADKDDPSTAVNIINDLAVDRSDIADGVDAEKEADVVPSTSNVDATNECEFGSVPSTDHNTLKDSALSSGDVEGEGVNIKEHESDRMLSTDNVALNIPGVDKNDDFDMTQELEPVSEPSSATELLEISDATVDLGPSAESDSINMPKELERNSEPSNADNTLEIPVLDNVVDTERVNIVNDLASDPKLSAEDDAPGPFFLGEDGLGEAKEPEPDSEALTRNIAIEDNKVDALFVEELDVVEGKSDELEGDSQQKLLVSLDSHTMDEPDVGGYTPGENVSVVHEVLTRSPEQEQEPVLNVAVNEVPHDDDVDGHAPIRQSEPSTSKETPGSPDMSGNDDVDIRIDAQGDLVVNSNDDSASNNLGDNDGLGNATETPETRNDVSFCGGEQEITETSEHDQSVRSKERENLPPDVIDQRTEGAKTTTENDNVLDDNTEQMVATVDHDLGRDKFMNDGSNHGTDVLDSELVGNINAPESPTREERSQEVDDTVSDLGVGDIVHETSAPEESLPTTYNKEAPVDETVSDQIMEDIAVHESPTAERSLQTTYNKEEPPVDEMVSDPPTSIKDKNKQEETQNTTTSADWGSYSLGIDEYHSPVTRNVSDDVLGKSMKDDRVSIEEGSSPDGKSSQDVDPMKENANVDEAEDFFNWPEDPSLRAFFTTPTTSRVNLKDSQEDMARFLGTNGTPTHDFHHQWGNESLRNFNEGTQDNTAHRGGLNVEPENEIFRVPDFEEFSQQYYADKEVDGSGEMSGKNEHFDFKVDQVSDLMNEEPGTIHHDAPPSGLKDNLFPSREFEEKQETQPKGSEMGGDLSFDKGMKGM